MHQPGWAIRNDTALYAIHSYYCLHVLSSCTNAQLGQHAWHEAICRSSNLILKRSLPSLPAASISSADSEPGAPPQCCCCVWLSAVPCSLGDEAQLSCWCPASAALWRHAAGRHRGQCRAGAVTSLVFEM